MRLFLTNRTLRVSHTTLLFVTKEVFSKESVPPLHLKFPDLLQQLQQIAHLWQHANLRIDFDMTGMSYPFEAKYNPEKELLQQILYLQRHLCAV